MIDEPTRSAAAAPPRIDGKFLDVAGRRFLVKGTAYGTFAPNEEGEQFPSPAQITQDFGLMSAAGLNTVRTYTVPSAELLDIAAQQGLRVIVGIPWAQHVAFLDDQKHVKEIRRNAVETVRRLGPHPATLMFAVGNEIPPSIVRWHGQRRVERFLRELYEETKAAAPESLLTYVNFPPTEYLDVDCFDLCAFNVYLHREADLRAYLARLQHIAGSRPLLLAEAGGDSQRNGLSGQTQITEMQLRAAFAEGACGAVAFSWTDEWWRGGHQVEEWAFGLVDAERRPKPVLAAVQKAFADAPFPVEERARWPKVSVVVCAYDAADTIDDCLTSLATLTYPDVEVIVINDGSRDATGAIARRHNGVRVIDVPNGGLSAARNVGLAEATGEFVAYTDADVRVDADWLTYLVQALLTQDVVGTGGPNVVPADDPWVAQCIARAPGSPTHVLLDDRVAEHVPGCNMAFRRDALLAIGGFNSVYVRAGDDVDVCWRLQAKGLRIGFAPSALVWHHHRQTVGMFWRQQVGYGESEAWLTAHHPEKFADGDMLWRGRIYSPLPFVRAFSRARVNTGVWGTAAFPSVYRTSAHPLHLLPHSPAWMAVSTVLLAAGALGQFASSSLGWLLFALGALGWTGTLVRCAVFARLSDLRGLPAIGQRSWAQSRFVYQVLIAWLHVIQPLARVRGRIRGLLSMPQVTAPVNLDNRPWKTSLPSWRDVRESAALLLGGVAERSFWSESWLGHATLLTDLAGILRASRPAQLVVLDDGWRADRDLSFAVARWGWLHVRMLVEEHAEGRCLVRAATRLRPSFVGGVQTLGLAVLLSAATAAAMALRWPAANAALMIAAVAMLTRGAWQAARATAVFDRALAQVATDAGMIALPGQPALANVGRGFSRASQLPTDLRPASAAGAIQALIITLLVGSVGIGTLSIAREARKARSVTAGPVAVDPSNADGGGVAVGISGDLFVADAQAGLIRRLRPRPPLDSPWTANDIGTDVYPLLGTSVRFDGAGDIALAPNGDLYIADPEHNRICRVTRSTATMVTIAGSGVAGFDGDGEPAERASLNGPSALAVAPNGDVYVADTLNNRIRVIERATRLIRTVAGDGGAANLNRPAGLAVAANGDLYVADTGNNRVLRITAGAGDVSTVAGDGTFGAGGDGGPAIRASLAAPMGLALAQRDGRLVIYVADSLNGRVRVVEPGGVITTLGGAARVFTPVRIAYHAAGWLYIKDGSPDGVTAVATSPPLRADGAAPPAVGAAGAPSPQPRAGGPAGERSKPVPRKVT
jgi:GT2 family glycosyltransferase/DNA-binding beta-propeller fold protein YncE